MALFFFLERPSLRVGLALPVRLAGLLQEPDDLGSWNKEVREGGGLHLRSVAVISWDGDMVLVGGQTR